MTARRPGFPADATGYGLLLLFPRGQHARLWPIGEKRKAVRAARTLAGELPTLRPFRVHVYSLGRVARAVYRCRYSAKLGRVVEVR